MRLKLFYILFCFTITSTAQVIEINHSISRLSITAIEGHHHIEYEGITNLSSVNPDINRPALPVYQYNVILPKNSIFESFEIITVERLSVADSIYPEVRGAPWRQNLQISEWPSSNINIWEQNHDYPKQVVRYLGTGYWDGQIIAQFEVFPVQYNHNTHHLNFISNIRFKIKTRFANAKKDHFRDLSDNYQMQQSEFIDKQTNFNTSMSDQPPTSFKSPFPRIEQGLIDRYIIITTEELAAAFMPLALWKTQKGVSAKIRTLSWIRTNFPSGSDDAERIRNFIRWSYNKRGTKYVLLGGDTDQVPTRMISTGGYTFPTDYYYSDLDGTWNANNNTIYGEAGDQTDAYPEIWVSRIPVETPQDVEIFTEKLFKYEKLENIANPEYPTNILYMAADLNKTDDGKDLIMRHIDPQINPQFNRTLLTQSTQIGTSHDIPLEELNKNYALIFTENHGAYHVIHPGKPGPSSIFAYELDHLTNSDPSIWYMASCETNDIAKRCFSEVFMRAENGGVAYVGNSSFEYPFSSIYLEKEFYNLVFNKNKYHLAEAHYLSRLPYLGYMGWEGPSRIIVLSTLVLGDPEMPIWTSKPQSLQVQIDSTVNLTFQITSSQDSLPVDKAIVVLYKENQMYKISESDVAGRAIFNFNEIQSEDFTVTITSHNFIPYQKYLKINKSQNSLKLSDVSFQEINGVANQKIEPGEEGELILTYQNSGTDTISGIFSIIPDSTESLIDLIDDSISTGLSLPPGERVAFQPISIRFSANIRVDTSIVLPLQIYRNQLFLKYDYLNLNISTPNLTISDLNWTSYMLENGDRPYKTSIDLQVQNNGSGDMDSVILSFSGDTTALSFPGASSCYLESIKSGQTIWLNNAISINHTPSLDSIIIYADVLSKNVHRRLQTLNFNNPAAVTNLNYSPVNEHAVLINWKPVKDKDISGYLVYRKSSTALTFKQIDTIHNTSSCLFLDDSLTNNEVYQYTIQAMDSSGNLSYQSTDTISAWPTLPYTYNDAIQIDEQAMGSNQNGVQIADLDLDGHNEIICSGGLGILKVYDDKLNQRFSINNLEGFLTLPAIGNVYGDNGLEMVVSTYMEGDLKNRIYVIDGMSGAIIDQFDLTYNAPTTVVLNDLDDNGFADIIVQTHAGNAPTEPKDSKLFIWKSDGSSWMSFPSWPGEGRTLTDNYCLGVPASARLTKAGEKSVIVSTQTGRLICFNPIVSSNPIWQIQIEGILNAPLSIADTDCDDSLEIIVPAVQRDKLYMVSASGKLKAGWENGLDIDITNPWYLGSPAVIGNLDNDPEQEIVYAGRQNLYIIDPDGIVWDGWPIPIQNGDDFLSNNYKNLCPNASPVLADLNQNGVPEIIFISSTGWLHAIDPGTQKDIIGFPINTHINVINGQSPMVEDVDRDGDLDILYLGHDGILHIWDTKSPYAPGSKIHWNQIHANPAHSGVLDTTELQITSDLLGKDFVEPPNRFYVKPNYPNPFNPSTTIEIGMSASLRVTVEIYNVLGQRVKVLLDGVLRAGRHLVMWNGRDALNHNASSGIYFYRVKVEGKSALERSGKMILIR